MYWLQIFLDDRGLFLKLFVMNLFVVMAKQVLRPRDRIFYYEVNRSTGETPFTAKVALTAHAFLPPNLLHFFPSDD